MAMNHTQPVANSVAASEPTGSKPRKWLQTLALLIIGGVLGAVSTRIWQAHRESHLVRQANLAAQVTFERLVPSADAKVQWLTREFREVENQLDEASMAQSSADIALPVLRQQQLRLQQVTTDLDQVLRPWLLPVEATASSGLEHSNRPLLNGEQQERLGRWWSQLERVREGLDTIAVRIDLVKARRWELVLNESARQAEPAPAPVFESNEQDLTDQTWQNTETFLPPEIEANEFGMGSVFEEAPPAPSYVLIGRPVWVRPCVPMVIGSTYPDRFLGYRSASRYWRPPVSGFR